jgi:dTDP-4-dehydrorhamnose 3,5-epimerase
VGNKLTVFDTAIVRDERGEFSRLYCKVELAEVIGARQIVQINRSLSKELGTVRGMHYQRAPHAEMKLIRCLKGRVWDVALDLRRHSPTFLRWHAVELTPDNARLMVVPEGCAHGFQTLEANTELLYLHTAAYASAHEAAVSCLDPRVAIAWPLPVMGLSSRDRLHPLLTDGFLGLDE